MWHHFKLNLDIACIEDYPHHFHYEVASKLFNLY